MIQNKIDSFHLEDIKNDKHPSVFFKDANYDLFILRLPYFVTNDDVKYDSLAFVIDDENYFYYDKNEQKFIQHDTMHSFYHFIDKKVDNVLELISFYSNEIESIEDKIYEGESIQKFNQKWFEYKTKLIRIHRVLNKAVETIQALIKSYKKEEDYLEKNFEDIYEHLTRSYRNAEHLLEKLDSIYNFNLNQTNEQMNKIVYILTLLSGIFLPLNLIVGFFGMNTTSLPFTQESGGTMNVIMVLLISGILAIGITFFMKRK